MYKKTRVTNQHTTDNHIFRKFLFRRKVFTIVALLLSSTVFAQLTGVKTIPGNYATIAEAVADVNALGVGAGGVTFNIAANYTETIATTISLTATGTAGNPVVFQKDPYTSGANPLLTAYTGGTATPASAVQDGIWRLSGSDYITIRSIDLRDNPANTTNPSTMEYGFALYKGSSSNGCQYNRIEGCSITLSNINNASATNPMTEGSAGIIVMNSTATSANVVIGPVAGGNNSYNKFYSNTIQNCNIGISVIGAIVASPFTLADAYNDIGGTSGATGNTIVNFGGASGAANPAAGIRTLAQYGLNVGYNTINNNNGSGSNHPGVLRGIYISTATSANVVVSHNTITINGGGNTQTISGIENVAGATAAGNTVSISNNSIINGTYTTATTGGFYGILNNGASPQTLIINNNTIANNSSAANTSGFFQAILNNGAALNATISNNSITGNSSGDLTTGSFAGINNQAATATLEINSNTVANNSTSAVSGPCYSITNSGAVTSSIIIDSNNIGTSLLPAITFTAANTASQLFISNTRGSTAASLSISNNNFYNVNYTTGGTGPNTYISNTAATLSQAISRNTFNSMNVNTTGSITFIANSVVLSSSGTQNINYNSIGTSFTKAGIGGTVTLFTSSATSVAGGVSNNNYNNFSNITINGATTMAGWVNTDAGGAVKTIQNNTFSNWTMGTSPVNAMNINLTGTNNSVSNNAINNITGGGAITGIGTAAGNDKIFSNTINTLSSTGALAVTGILVTAGTNKNIYKNKIYDLAVNNPGGTVSGITVSGSTIKTVNIYNNLIGNLRAPLANTSTDVIRGMSITATATNSTINAYYNTISINGTSTGTNFSSSGIYHTASATATTAYLNLRNNIISNTSAPKGTGISVAFRRSTTALNNYATTSDNNLFYASSSGTNRLIFYDGANSDQTLTAYKARVATRDALSVTEDLITNSKFLSTTGSSSSFLHLDPSKANLAESGAININNYTTDYDGLIRQGNTGYSGSSTAPDIGASEINGTRSAGLSGSYNVGTGQTFTSLTNADGLFAAINSVGLSGNVVVNITSDLTEDGSNSLYQWVEQVVGNYSLTIQPGTSTARLISGNVLNGLIRFNGAKRVTINGSNGTGSNYLTFRNTNSSGTTATAFTFINGASNNAISYCNIESYANATSGVILFGTSTESGGNSNNTVNNCNVNATVSGNNGSVAVYSAGTATAGYSNSNNTLANNNIYNYRDRGLDITATGTTGWTISGNSFYNGSVSAGIDYAAASVLFAIRILGGAGYTISNNFMGGNASLVAGTTASYSSSTGLLTFQGISLTTSFATPTSNIKGNTIANISVSAVPTSTASTGSNVFIGIETNGSGINIGGSLTGEGNIIGSNTTNGSIFITTTTSLVTNKSNIRGISCSSTGGAVTGNQVGSIDIKNIGSGGGPSTLIGIYISNATPPSQVINNIIGSTGSGAASNSIRILSSSTSTTSAITGIFINTSVTSAIQVTGNIVQNLANLVSGASSSIIGISNSAALNAVVTINSNTITANSTNASTGGIYGIYSNGATTSVTISNNTISSNSSSAATSGYLYGVYTSGSPLAITVSNNTYSGNSITAISLTGFTGIANAANPSSLNITGNTFYGNSTTAATGAFYAINNSGAVTSVININNNNIGTSSYNAITYNVANSAGQILINNSSGTASSSLSISNNTFQGVSYAMGGTASTVFISNTYPTLSQAINSNTFTNLNLNSSGNATFITNSVAVPATGTQNINNNSISGTFTKSAGGTVTLFTSSASSVSGSIISNSNNNFSNITVSGATTIAGWVNTDAGASTKMVQNNTFNNWTGGTNAVTALTVNATGSNNATSGNTISNISGANAVTGITTGIGNDNMYSNAISSLSTSGAFAVNGISITAGTTKNIYKNKIYDLQAGTSASGTVNGILVSGGTTVNIYNNLVGNLRTPAASASDPIRGISVTSAIAPSNINVYYNTVYINATSTGTNFGSTGIYHTTSTTATTSALNLRNNIITNTSTANGTGYTVAYRLSSTILTNYVSTSDNNLFYAGTPGVKKLVFWDGTNGDQTIAAYKTRVSARDASSVTEDVTTKFLSTIGSSPVFLHIDSMMTSVVKNGAVNISGYTDDFDGQIRYGNTGYSGAGTAPTIGADEAFSIESIAPSITYSPLANTTIVANRALTGVVINDASGINTAAGTKPRIYYKRSADANVLLDNTSITNGWKYTEASNTTSPFSFTIDYSLLYGGSAVTAGSIQYFVVAQDLATTANVAINSGTFTTSPANVALTSSAFPVTGSINSYNIAFSGTYNVGTSEVYTSLTKANGLFASINNAGLMGNTTVNITSDLAEDGTNALNQWTETGVGNYTLTIQSDAATIRTISGNVSNGLIRLSGADRVTIDGSNSGSGNYLSFKNTNTSGATGTAFTFINGSSNNIIKYCNAEAYANATNGVILFSTSSVSGGNSNNLIDNCLINASSGANTGNVVVYSAGTIGNENISNTVSNNTLYGYKDRGLDISATGSSGWKISANSFYNGNVTGSINYLASSVLHGIRVLGGTGYSIVNNYIGGSAVSALGPNAVYSSNLGNITYQGILLTTSGSSPASNIKGNTIASISVSSIPTSATSVLFTGIETSGSGINIGGSSAGEGNLIGSAGINSSIIITTSTTASVNTSVIKAINCSSTGGSISGNQAAGIDVNNIGTVPASSSFSGIYINSGTPPSQVTNNIIGSRETANSIRVLSTSGAASPSITGISLGSSVTSNVLINGNMIENISNQSLTSSGSFTGINNGAASGTVTVSYDTIQNISSAANAHSGSSVYSGISSACASSINNNIISNISHFSAGINAQVTGITASGAFAHTISANFISGLVNASAKENANIETGSPLLSAVAGILNTATVAGQVIYGNTLYNLNTTNTGSLNTMVTGIGVTASVSGNIYNNRIAGFSNQATGSAPGIIGIMGAGGSFNLYNNAIKLDNSVYVNGIKVYGIVHSSGATCNYFHNTVNIAGNATGTALRSADFLRAVTQGVLLRNNVFINTRTGTGKNYAISNITATPSSGWSSSASNYNDLYSATPGTVGEWGASTDKTFTQWQTTSGGEANSITRSVSFITSLYDLQADTVNCALNNSGTPITTPVVINTDLNNAVRSSTAPDLGAYEFNYTSFVVSASSNSPVCSGTLISLSADPGTALNAIYSWTDPNSAIIASEQEPDVTAIAGIYTVTVTDGTGCISTDTTIVAITPAPASTLSGPAFICSGNSATLSLTLTGSGTISGSLSSGDVFNGNASNITINVSPSSSTAYYITTLSDDNCMARPIDHPDTARVNVFQTGNWIGVASSDWNDASNWSCGGIPPAGSSVTIPSPSAFYPIITTSQSVNNITIASGASLTVNGALQIAGTITNNGSFTALNGTIEMNGSTAQTISSGTFAGNQVQKLIISSNVTLLGSMYVSGKISFGNVSNKTLTTSGYLTLGSSSTGTAMVADLTNSGTSSGNSISGEVTVEKYIPAKRAFRFLTSPVNSLGSIRSNWMENTNNPNTSVNNNPVPGYGIHITGTGGNVNGFDATATNNPSLYTFDNQNQVWVAPSNTTSVLKAGNAYRALVRGNRGTNLNINNSTPTPAILRVTGSLVNGTIVMAKPGGGGTAGMPQLSPATNGYSFIGNPYASPVNWLSVQKADIGNTIFIFDPTVNGSNGRGAYVSYNATLGANNNVSSLVDNHIQSWQSFFVFTTGPNPTLTFKETHKSNLLRAVFRTMSDVPRLTVQLLLPQQVISGGAADGFATYFSNEFSSGLSDEDSYKFTNQDENIGILRYGKVLSMEGRKPVTENDTIPVKMWQLTQPSYTFKIGSYNFPGNVTCYLEDAFLHTSTVINSGADMFITFNITADTGSVASDRFRFVFKASATLPLQFSGIKAFEKNKGSQVEWTVFEESNVVNYTVERSCDALHFAATGSVQPTVNTAPVKTYLWRDDAPFAGDNFYRIKVTLKTGEVKYTGIAKVHFQAGPGSITIYPNPAENNKIQLHLLNLKKGEYHLQLLTTDGSSVYSATLMHVGGSAGHIIKVDKSLAKGVYRLLLTDGKATLQQTVLLK